MPIEDVDYLLKNSTPESVMLFIDSSRRDRLKYPTPSEYTIDLDEAIPNVYGIDILDASIPCTMYNVDRYNNMLRMISIDREASSLFQHNYPEQSPEVLDALEKEHIEALTQEFSALGYASPLNTVWMPTQIRYDIIVTSWNDGDPLPVGILPFPKSIETFDNSGRTNAVSSMGQMFRVIRKRSFGPIPVKRGGASPDIIIGDIAYTIAIAEGPYLVEAIRAREELSKRINIGDDVAFVPCPGSVDLFMMVVYDIYRLADEDDTESFERLSATCRLKFTIVTVLLEIGNYTGITAIQLGLQNALIDAKMSVIVKFTTSVAEKQARLRLVCNNSMCIMISTPHSTITSLLGFDQNPMAHEFTTARNVRPYNAVQFGRHSELFVSVNKDDGTSVLDAPGIITLMGFRYVTLRCPDIEQHVGAVGKYGPFSTGIGVFKMLNPNEVSQIRFDYISLVRKPFHPIAKLSRLKFKFELNNNVLYDFKGVNHQILLTIKYYSPTPTSIGNFPYILNPNYNPDLMAYVANRTAYADRLDQPGFDPYNEDYTTTDEGDEEDDYEETSR